VERKELELNIYSRYKFLSRVYATIGNMRWSVEKIHCMYVTVGNTRWNVENQWKWKNKKLWIRGRQAKIISGYIRLLQSRDMFSLVKLINLI